MEFIPLNSSIHYKCALDVYCSRPEAMTSLRRIIRNWCLRKTRQFSNEELHSAWFFRGDSSQHKVGSFMFRTAINVGHSTLESPDNWALEVIHSDSRNRNRKWSIEISLSKKDDGCIRFVTTSKHWMNEGYIGVIPDDPEPSVPGYVRSIIEAGDFLCRKGDEQVLKAVKEIDVGSGKNLFERITSEERFLPIIVVSKSSRDDRYQIDTAELHSKILGSANIYLLKNERATKEFNYFIGSEFQCLDGSLRIYMPKVRIDRPYDSNRHRYYSERHLLEQDFLTISSEIIIGLSRNARAFTVNEIISISDIVSQNRKFRIQQLFADKNDSQSEELNLLWEEIDALNKKLADIEGISQLYESENEGLKQETSNLRWKASQTESLRDENDDLKNQISAFDLLNKLPQDLPEVVNFIANAFKSKLYFTEEAIKSARDYENGNAVFTSAWEMLRSIATVLHRLIFEDRPGDLEEFFKNETGFELSMTEGRQTKRDSSLMKLRKITYKDQEIDITPHVKYGNRPPNLLRIHFYPDMERQIIVIGHCGEHLDNFTTKSVG